MVGRNTENSLGLTSHQLQGLGALISSIIQLLTSLVAVDWICLLNLVPLFSETFYLRWKLLLLNPGYHPVQDFLIFRATFGLR